MRFQVSLLSDPLNSDIHAGAYHIAAVANWPIWHQWFYSYSPDGERDFFFLVRNHFILSYTGKKVQLLSVNDGLHLANIMRWLAANVYNQIID